MVYAGIYPIDLSAFIIDVVKDNTFVDAFSWYITISP